MDTIGIDPSIIQLKLKCFFIYKKLGVFFVAMEKNGEN